MRIDVRSLARLVALVMMSIALAPRAGATLVPAPPATATADGERTSSGGAGHGAVRASEPPALGQGLRPDQVQGLVAREHVDVHWIDGTRLWYEVSLGHAPSDPSGDRRAFMAVDAARASREPLFDHESLAKALTSALHAPIRADALPIERIAFDGETVVLLLRGGRIVRWSAGTGGERTLTEGSDEDARRFAVGLRPTLQSSRRNAGASILLEFDNRTAGRVTLAWIDADGHRRDYGTIASGEHRSQQTFSGHAWALYDEHGELVGSLIAPRLSGVVHVGESDGPKAGSDELPVTPTPAPTSAQKVTAAPDLTCRTSGPNVEVVDAAGAVVFATSDGTPQSSYAEPFVWSPDRTKLLLTRRQPPQTHPVTIVESSPRDRLQPTVRTFDYLKPGDAIEMRWPVIADIAAKRIIVSPDQASLFGTPWSVDHVAWDADSSHVSFLYNERGHRTMRLISLDAATGAARPIIDERCATFFDYAGKLFLERLDDRGEIVWMSERDGWNHLYRIDATTGAVKNQITKGPWVVRGVDRIDRATGQIWFRAGGIRPDQDPYHVHHCRVNLDGSGLVVLTEGDGTHEIEWSADRSYFIDRWSRVDLPTVTELRRGSDGSLVVELERGDWSALLATGWIPPERFVAKGRDGVTDIWGVLWRPSVLPASPASEGHATKAARGAGPPPIVARPVIENIYAGPQGSFVPKAFSPWHGQRELAELGFVVVQIDGMGTSNRSKAFHDVCWKNLKDAGFPDRIAWIKAAAATRPDMDISRVGIYGGSAGGQNAMRALLDHNDFYSAAAADCGCHDNRMDKIWWNELWMGWPVDESYERSSNVVDAGKLKGALLLTVGELDQNVDPSSTMQVVDALVRANRPFELLVLPGMGHGAGESEYGRRRRAEFFVRHLLGVNAPSAALVPSSASPTAPPG